MCFYKYLFFVVLFIASISCSQSTQTKKLSSVSIVSYNTENLFDTINKPNTFDDDFTPKGKMRYDSYRYFKKLKHIAEVLNDIDSRSPILLLGLNEVENNAVLNDLANELNSNLSVIHKETDDVRGIDNALLYNSDYFTPIKTELIKIKSLKNSRGILYTKGIFDDDTIHAFVNHWSSRSGGVEQTNYKRQYASATLKTATDSILNENPSSQIILLGDFNDDEASSSIKSFINNSFIDCIKGNDSIASYKYKKDWVMLDHIMLNQKFDSIYTIESYIYKSKAILEKDKKHGGLKPFRTYIETNYIDGYSDHLPIYITLSTNQ